MQMTPAQDAIIRAYINATPILSSQPKNGDGHEFIANHLNAQASPPFYVWRSSTQTSQIMNAIVWSALTPTFTVMDGSTTLTNSSLVSQNKQINLQLMLQGQYAINTGLPNIRSGLQDALTNVPSGANGATANAGWPAVKAVISRTATLAEKMLATGTGTQGSPADLGIDGPLGNDDIDRIRSIA